MKAIFQNVFDNPILTRELRRRMRGKALVYSIIGYIILMTVLSIVVLLAHMGLSTISGEETDRQLARLTDTGHALFRTIGIIQSLLVLIIAPTITAGMTTGEKERKTFDFLRVTTISPWMYITGCFLSTVFYVGLALLCGLPLISLAFLYGGVSREQVMGTSIVLLAASMILSAFGLYISSVRERTRTAQGIVVFLIFSLLFGGYAAAAKLMAWLGSSGIGSQGLSGIAFTIGGWGIPLWGLLLLCALGVTTVFLLVAARKLFEPDDSRAFNHWQFALIFLIVIGIAQSAGMVAGGKEDVAIAYLLTGNLMLAVAAGCFAVGRMEVGDEIWHLKRLVPVLRPFDQTLPFLLFIAASWYLLCNVFAKTAPAASQLQPVALQSALWIGIASFAFFCAFGRFATSVAIGRKGAGRMLLAMMITVWLVIPLVSGIMVQSDTTGGFFYDVGSFVGRLSPIFVVIDSISNPESYRAAKSITDHSSVTIIGLYGALAILFLVLGEVKRFKRWRGFDYHYDMPAA